MFFVLNMPFMPESSAKYEFQRQECVSLVNSQCSIKQIVIEGCYPSVLGSFIIVNI